MAQTSTDALLENNKQYRLYQRYSNRPKMAAATK